MCFDRDKYALSIIKFNEQWEFLKSWELKDGMFDMDIKSLRGNTFYDCKQETYIRVKFNLPEKLSKVSTCLKVLWKLRKCLGGY